ncbi:hypothetical protein Tco_0467865 [Tanacetum coccineum]
MYHDLCLGREALAERENMGFDLTRSDICPSFVKDLTKKGVGLRMADSHTGNHREDGFTPLETIRMFLGIIGSRSLLGSKGRPSSPRRGSLKPGVIIGWLEENDGVNKGVNNEDIEDEDVEIELNDDAELIFPYDVEGDKTPPPGDEYL